VRRRALRWLAASLLAPALLAGCRSAPPGEPTESAAEEADEEKKPEVVLRTEVDDQRVGEEAAEQVAAEMGLLEDPELLDYVNRVGQRLALQAPSGRFDYSFQIIDQDVPNAFALPGGFIYVSRGLLVLSNSEAELANVLAHEIVHVARRHASARQSAIPNLPGIFQYGIMRQVAAYGRNQEREADRLGQQLAGGTGYDPDGMAHFLKALEFTERLRLGFSREPGYFDTHPTTSERVATAGAQARAITWRPQPGIARDRGDYLSRLDGLVVGIGGSEGVFQRDRFLHPDLGFSMRFPSTWDVINTRQAVGAVSPQRDAQVYLEFDSQGDDPQKAAEDFLAGTKAEGLRVEDMQPVLLGDLRAFRVEGRASSPRSPVTVHLTWVAREGSVYRLTGVAMGARNRLVGVFNSVARSFRPLTPKERESIHETRLRIVPARDGETLAELSERTGNEWNIQQTAVMNDVFANDRLVADQLVKVAIPQPYGRPPPDPR
jgi:predicted Zn-dependent protease